MGLEPLSDPSTNRVVKQTDDYFADLRYVRKHCGKSYLRQIVETLRLMAGPGHLSPWDYHRYRLWDDALSWEQKREFIGNNSHGWFLHQVNSPEQEPAMRDKFAADRTLRRAGIRTPRVLALFQPKGEMEGVPVLRSARELAAFLRSEIDYPFFYKPVTSNSSVGIGLARSLDRATDIIHRLGDPPIAVEEFAREMEARLSLPTRGAHQRPDQGYLFQSLVTNHPLIAERCGGTAATFRVYVITDDRPARVPAVNWKIPGPDSPADNSLRQGNLYAHVDLKSGEVLRVKRGRGARLELFDDNPYTGWRLTGFRIPYFEEILETVVRGSALFPGARYQGWDVAVDADGPIVIEANYGAGFDQAHLSTGRGLLTPEFREYIRRAKKLNTTRGSAWPVSWSRHESIWRLSGVGKLVQSFVAERDIAAG